MHKRRTSNEKNSVTNQEDQSLEREEQSSTVPNLVAFSQPNEPSHLRVPSLDGSKRIRVRSTPAPHSQHRYSQSTVINGYHSPAHSPSPLVSPTRSTFFPGASPSSPSFRNPSSSSASYAPTLSAVDPLQEVTSPSTELARPRKHTRIHSRNLSVFFPRPGQLPPASIAEDGTQEIVYDQGRITPTSVVPPARSRHLSDAHTRANGFGQGFKFGGRPSSASDEAFSPIEATSPVPSTTSQRRGHHHKHSMSHNFFSFMEPGANLPNTPAVTVDTGSVPPSATSLAPPTPWLPMSPFQQVPGSPASATRASAASPTHSATRSPLAGHLYTIVAYSAAEFIAGAWVWVAGQQSGSLSCTGLGYWIVFDALGVLLGGAADSGLWAAVLGTGSSVRRPYGHERVETTALFAQTIYLLFAGVYVCKETVEHLLLTFGDSHHHHRMDEYEQNLFGIAFPTTLLFASFLALVGSTMLYSNHAKLVSATGPSTPSFSLRALYHVIAHSPAYHKLRSALSMSGPTLKLPRALSEAQRGLDNPFFLVPALFSCALLFTALFISPDQHRLADLVLAGVETVMTFRIAYPAAVALATVLLQTAPERGALDGRMEAFLRVMKEVERHPSVIHLPPPHIWQLVPPTKTVALSLAPASTPPAPALVVALELHVRKELGDAEVLELTRWAWERVYLALAPRHGPLNAATAWADGSGGGVTVGIVHG